MWYHIIYAVIMIKRNITDVLAYVTIASAFLTIFAHTEDPIMGSNPGLYYKIQYMIAFWL